MIKEFMLYYVKDILSYTATDDIKVIVVCALLQNNCNANA